MDATTSICLVSCFFNSKSRLSSFFDALRGLDFGRSKVEIVWVDNASKDTTHELLKGFADSWDRGRIAVVQELRAGLMYARCTGMRHVTAGWVVFLDDDNLPLPNFITELSQLIHEFPGAKIFTGNAVLPQRLGSAGRVGREALRLLAVRDEAGTVEFPMTSFCPELVPWGAGFCARREEIWEACDIWEREGVGIAGRTGSGLSGGEDLWIAHRITSNGGSVVFSDRLRLIHDIDERRIEKEHLIRIAIQNGMDKKRLGLAIQKIKPGVGGLTGWKQSLWAQGMLQLPRNLLKASMNRSFDDVVALATTMGYILSIVQRRESGTER